MISSVDKDGTGSIDFREFLILMSDQMKVRNRYSNDNTPRGTKLKDARPASNQQNQLQQRQENPDRLNLSELEDLNMRDDSTLDNQIYTQNDL